MHTCDHFREKHADIGVPSCCGICHTRGLRVVEGGGVTWLVCCHIETTALCYLGYARVESGDDGHELPWEFLLV